MGCETTVEEKKCAYCNGVIAGKPYVETIGDKEYTFHTKEGAVAFKKKKK